MVRPALQENDFGGWRVDRSRKRSEAGGPVPGCGLSEERRGHI